MHLGETRIQTVLDVAGIKKIFPVVVHLMAQAVPKIFVSESMALCKKYRSALR